MKISEMNNEQATEALIRLSVPFSNICDDEEAVKIIEQYKEMGNRPILNAVGAILPQTCTYLLKKHKEDLYEIVGALTFKKAAEVARMNFFDTINIIRDSYDEVLKRFFTSSKAKMQNIAEKR